MRHPPPPLSPLFAFALGLAPLLSCGARAPAETAHVTLGGDTVARVGSVSIPASLVSKVAGASNVEPRIALDRLIDDALAAEAARAAGVDKIPHIQWASEAILGRATIDALVETAHAAGPPTDAEVAAASDAHFRELALPEQLKVIHAVVVRPKAADPDRARALAAQIAQAVAGAKDADDFEARAKAVPTNGFEMRVERLDSFIADGRTAEGAPNGYYAPDFVAGALPLAKPGDTSGVVETSFGWHVIRLLERRPPHVLPLEERRAILTSEVMVVREHDALEAVFAAARARVKGEIQPDAFTVMSSISFEAPR